MSNFEPVLSDVLVERIYSHPALAVFDIEALLEAPDATEISAQNRSLLNEIRADYYVVILSPYNIVTTIQMVGLPVGITYVGMRQHVAYGQVTPSDPVEMLQHPLSNYNWLKRFTHEFNAHSITIVGTKHFASLFINAHKLKVPLVKVLCSREAGSPSKFFGLARQVDITIGFEKLPQLLAELYLVFNPDSDHH